MSWGRKAEGSAARVREEMAKWAPEVKATDSTYANKDVVNLHQEQVAKVVDATERFLAAAPSGYAFTVHAGGHAHAETTRVVSDQWYVHLAAHKPADGEVVLNVGGNAFASVPASQADGVGSGG